MHARSYGNEPTKEPTLAGVGGRAWRIEPSNIADLQENASVGSDWLVYAPQAHPFWWWYMISVVHLRPLPDKGPAHIRFPGASHEVMVLALNPEHPLPDVDHWQAMKYLTPPDLAEQFIVRDDDQARELGDLLVRHIVVDGMSPDQDHRGYWQRAVANTAEHLRLGRHPDQGE